MSMTTEKKRFIEKDLGINGTPYGIFIIGVFCVTEEREEHLLVGFPKRNNHCLMPLEWCLIYQNFVQKCRNLADKFSKITIK